MSEEARGNRFIPDPDKGLWGLLARPCIWVSAGNLGGELVHPLVDNHGYIVTLYELLEILAAVKPFYDKTPDRDIEALNQEHDERLIAKMEEGSKTKSRRQPTPPKARPGFVYVLQAGPFYKIGLTTSIDRRIKQLAALPPFDLELVCRIAAADMYQLEADLHARFADKQKRGEWYELTPADLDYIRALEGERCQDSA